MTKRSHQNDDDVDIEWLKTVKSKHTSTLTVSNAKIGSESNHADREISPSHSDASSNTLCANDTTEDRPIHTITHDEQQSALSNTWATYLVYVTNQQEFSELWRACYQRFITENPEQRVKFAHQPLIQDSNSVPARLVQRLGGPDFAELCERMSEWEDWEMQDVAADVLNYATEGQKVPAEDWDTADFDFASTKHENVNDQEMEETMEPVEYEEQDHSEMLDTMDTSADSDNAGNMFL